MKRVAGIFLFLIGLVFLILIAGRILEPKNNLKEFGMRDVKANGILGEKEDTIDCLVIGDSEAYSAISPMEIWHDKGFTTYVSATSAQMLYESENYLLQALTKQKPKVVILETNAIFREYSLTMNIYNRLKREFKVFEYHDLWKKFDIRNLGKKKEYTWVDDYKGYYFSKKTQASKVSDYMAIKNEEVSIPRLNIKKLESIMKICEDNNITLLLVSTPSTVNWNYARHIAIKDFANENNLTYIDLNMKDLGIDWHKDTRDKGDHLNYFGAKKVSLYLADYLSKEFNFENKKDDKVYLNWNDSYKRYEREVSA